ncbi:MAG TPA: LCP family protein [Candidatus Limivivens intestinipullorum]|uniref:LCP family protein n=1 Tax=Candidatus Limivivens intestinipullorum TaxID=2840858 RepID=A0A9D1EU06_9FIRM|nr:LCP family protein [Candidatus Limivivens intestinipullorum]
MKRKTKIILAVCIAFVCILTAGGFAAYFSVHRLYSAANYVSNSEVEAQRAEWEAQQREKLLDAGTEGASVTSGRISTGGTAQEEADAETSDDAGAEEESEEEDAEDDEVRKEERNSQKENEDAGEIAGDAANEKVSAAQRDKAASEETTAAEENDTDEEETTAAEKIFADADEESEKTGLVQNEELSALKQDAVISGAMEDQTESETETSIEDTSDSQKFSGEEAVVPEELTEYLTEESAATDGDVYNVLLIGVDRRDDSWAGNSDSMILLSINREKKQLSLISLMRDTYVEIPEIGMDKLNAAHAYGAGPLLVETVSQNFEIDVDRYVRVDFEGMINIIDRIGKMQISMTDDEVIVANDYIRAMCDSLDRDPEDYLIPEGGTIECDGMRAVAYARIRYVGNYDYQRTERQRLIMTNLIQELSDMNLFEIYDTALDILPLVTHNIPESEIWSLLLQATELFDYTIVQDRIPYDGLFENQKINEQDVLVPEWEETIERLKDTIY